jgi:hypothetical protein
MDRLRPLLDGHHIGNEGQTIMTAEPKSEADLIRAVAEDLALEILASYEPARVVI